MAPTALVFQQLSSDVRLATAEAARIISELAGSDDVTQTPANSLKAIRDALEQCVMDDDSRCELQLSELETLQSLQRFTEMLDKFQAIRPVSAEQEARLLVWAVRLNPQSPAGAAAAVRLLEKSDELPLSAPNQLYLRAIKSASRVDAITQLQELLEQWRTCNCRRTLRFSETAFTASNVQDSLELGNDVSFSRIDFRIGSMVSDFS